ncbi:helix-turn-helix domain-containing protein [Acetoanaerobium noterae]|uniref:helix-turn-helix domain-containing protein n=1 Tax=Acetoanaerobium noterae TaxID=745369 RepID=UPI00333E2B33
MPFKKITVSEIIENKRLDKDFNSNYLEVKKEYELIKQVVEMRKKKNISQKDLANMVGISQQEISRFENEKHIPKLTSFIRIIEALDIDIKLEAKKLP